MNDNRSLILIVDDMPENIDVLYNILKNRYEIIVAKNGEKALKLAKEKLPDLILLDILMPAMDGYEVCKKLKNDESTKVIPIIFLTAKSNEEDIERGLKCGVVDYVSKPFNTDELEARIETHLHLK